MEGPGSVYWNGTDTHYPSMEWQFFPYEDYYVMRNKQAGPDHYLSTTLESGGSTVPSMRITNTTDSSMFWTTSNWDNDSNGDATWSLSNQLNGTGQHLAAETNAEGIMTNEITAGVDLQRFIFSQLTAINNDSYSTIYVCDKTKGMG